MNGGKNRAGYTILEVLIVLAVSGIMFLIAANFISGKQAKTAFTTGTNSFAAKMQDVSTQVQNGQFSDVNFGCTSTTPPISFDSNVSQGQGTNSGCVFVGKFVYFTVGGSTSKYDVMMLAGIDGSTNYSTLRPITPGTDIRGTLDLTAHYTVPQSLDVKRVSVGASNTQVYGIAFLQDVSGTSSNQLTLAYLPAATLPANQSETVAASRIVGNLSTTDRINICVTDGTRYGIVEFGTDQNGAASSQSNAKLKVTNASDPLCQ